MSTPRRVSIRYFAKVAAWSELPRAQVTTARGASARSSRPRRQPRRGLRSNCARTTSPASRRLAEQCVARVPRRDGEARVTHCERAQLGDEVVGVAAVDRTGRTRPRARRAGSRAARPAGPASPVAGVQQLRLLGGEQQRAQALQRAHRAVAGALERFVERDADRVQRGQAVAATMVAYSSAHRRVVGEAQAVEAVDRRARARAQRQRLLGRHRAFGALQPDRCAACARARACPRRTR